MRGALVQLTSGRTVAPNFEVLEAHIRAAAAEGAEFVFTPETSLMMETRRAEVLEKARYEAEDETLAALQALVIELGVWLNLGSIMVKVADDRLANRSFLIGPDGEIKARYDKIHLFDVDLGEGQVYRESALYEAGSEAVVVDTPFGLVGMTVCYDLRFPYLYRALAGAGARILLVPAAFTRPTGEAHWHALLRARAIENGAFVIAAAQTGDHETGRATYGHSLVISPWGEVVADAGTAPGVTLFDIDLAKVDAARQKVPSLDHTRTFSVARIEAP
ncbi:carbon-nitrogen hydrolase family protein [Pseudokordiimonas caeni]|uniref:carbon-nitrogen hydrolase family protein n=1 Tax=Pseudokordiimonas caeni TaxID=2997908 RepID=UPI00281230D2|nr:carbon-nitrogen hydrolase family protein [Pseudokordiimonas caeni]